MKEQPNIEGQPEAQPPELTTTREHGPSNETPRIYVASLADYNAGRLHGAWIDAAQDVTGLGQEIDAMLKKSTEPIAEEWAIHDYDNFGSLRFGEYESLETISAIAKGIAEQGPAFAAWAGIIDKDLERLADFEEGYQGEWDSVEAYAENLLDDLGIDDILDKAIADSVRPYIRVDAEALARDMEISGDIVSVPTNNGSVWVFNAL
jgi:antirestriction protein